MNLKKYISLLLVIVITVSLCLTGCSRSDDEKVTPAGGAGRLNTATTEAATEEPEPLPKNGITICVDPGHGFDDPGAFEEQYLGDIYEKDITIAVAKLFKDHLEDLGFTVIMTHDGESFPKTAVDDGNNRFWIEERVSYANSLGNTIDYYISLHCDKFVDSSEVSGTRIHYATNVDANTEPDIEIAEALAKKLDEDFPEANDVVITSNSFYVIMYTKVPACLVEMGFVSNPDDAAKLIDPEWQDKFAKSLADGLHNYFVPSSN